MQIITLAAALVLGIGGHVGTDELPTNHTLPACAGGAIHVWMDYKADTYTDDGGHTTGPAATLTCNPSPPNRLHIRGLPSSWTLAQAHNYCGAVGAFAQTNFAGEWYVCPDIDY